MVFVFAFLKLLFVEYTISYPSAFSAAAQDTEIFLLLLAFANFSDGGRGRRPDLRQPLRKGLIPAP